MANSDTAKAQRPTVKEWVTLAGEEGKPWKPTEAGESLEGVYEGFAVATDPAGLDGKPREFRIYAIREEDGTVRSVYGTWKLDGVFDKIVAPKEVRLVYMGKINISGGQTMNDFRIETRVA